MDREKIAKALGASTSFTEVPLGDCVKGRIYRIKSRNLSLGMYDGEYGFVGIRLKFDNRFLFTEYHHTSPSFPTVIVEEEMDVLIPEWIKPWDHIPGSVDSKTGKAIYFDGQITKGGRGWVFVKDDEPSEDISPSSYGYKPLFEILDKLEKEEWAKRMAKCEAGDHKSDYLCPNPDDGDARWWVCRHCKAFIRKHATCPTCDGRSGKFVGEGPIKDQTWVKCEACEGKGEILPKKLLDELTKEAQEMGLYDER